MSDVPDPILGGTFFYCPWEEKIPHGVMACGWLRPGWATGTRFRSLKRYRRHWRRNHAHAG